MADIAEHTYAGHPATWWAQFAEVTDRFDAALVTAGLADAIIPKIRNQLLRREAEIAAEVAVLYFNKVDSQERARRANKAVGRLEATVLRLTDRSTADDARTSEAFALIHALRGRWDEAAAEAEAFVGTQPLLRIFVAALRLERFDLGLAVRLIRLDRDPQSAIQAGLIVGRYMWWPEWLLKIVTDRAVAGTLDEQMITAMDRCAYAELSPIQAKLAGKLLTGDQSMIETSASRLEGLGEDEAAAKLREGDLTAVALAARLTPL